MATGRTKPDAIPNIGCAFVFDRLPAVVSHFRSGDLTADCIGALSAISLEPFASHGATPGVRFAGRSVSAREGAEFYAMATKRMLVDAIHPEETRIVVTNGNKLEEFDFESAQRRQLRGNIYLAKVTRVEPSLQAAFIEYGGNRHGFLAFSEIHPDYYQIPVADREALLREEEAHEADDHASDTSEAAAPTEADADADPQSTEPDDEEHSHIEQAPTSNEPVESIGGSDALEDLQERRRPIEPDAPVQDPGSHQAPPGDAGPGGQGRARQQGRGSHHLPLARRPLLGADAQYRPWRRHLAQDHQCRRPQASQGHRRGSRSATRPGHHPADRRCQPHQGRSEARFRIPAAPVGKRPLADPQVAGPLPRL